MSQRTCQQCGQTFSGPRRASGRDAFCNLGCAIRARVPVDDQGNFPVNQHLIAVLVLGFLFFNQVLTASLSALLAHRERAGLSAKLAWISIGFGLLVWLGVRVVQGREKVRHGIDFGFAAVTLTMGLAAIWKSEPRFWLAVAATSILLIWNLRGLTFDQRLT